MFISNFKNLFILTCDASSDKQFVKAGSEELGGFASVSDWLTSGTNSFCNSDEQPTVRGIMMSTKQHNAALTALSPDQGRCCERTACSAGPVCLG